MGITCRCYKPIRARRPNMRWCLDQSRRSTPGGLYVALALVTSLVLAGLANVCPALHLRLEHDWLTHEVAHIHSAVRHWGDHLLAPGHGHRSQGEHHHAHHGKDESPGAGSGEHREDPAHHEHHGLPQLMADGLLESVDPWIIIGQPSLPHADFSPRTETICLYGGFLLPQAPRPPPLRGFTTV